MVHHQDTKRCILMMNHSGGFEMSIKTFMNAMDPKVILQQ